MKRIGLAVFENGSAQVGATVSWFHPRARAAEGFRTVAHWVDMARLLDAADFDFLFFAGGGFGYPSVQGVVPEAMVSAGLGVNVDPSYVIPAMAAATKGLGFVITSTTGADHPMHTVKKFTSLDNFTDGRIGWNIVTGSSQDTHSALLGQTSMVAHDDRYALAQEYVDVALKFWEGAWEDGAVLLDREEQVFADHAKMHRIEHDGAAYRSSGFNMYPPGPQRTPTLFQAGTSEAGRELAAHNAEGVFVQGTTPGQTAQNVADIRRRAAARGRDPDALKLYAGVTVCVAATPAEARAQRAEFEAMQTDELTATVYAGNTGVDLLSLDPDRSLAQVFDDDPSAGQMGRSNIERFLPQDGGPAPTVGEVLQQLRGRGTRGFVVTGDAVGVADQLEELAAATDLDGFMLEPIADLASLGDFIDLVVPELRARGRLERAPGGTSLRERITGEGPHLSPQHHGAGYRP